MPRSTGGQKAGGTAAERVAAGAAFLDEHDPGWLERIDPGQLTMNSGGWDVLGQLCPREGFSGPLPRNVLYGAYLSGLNEVLAINAWGYALGFGPAYVNDRKECDALIGEWRGLIAERRGGNASRDAGRRRPARPPGNLRPRP